MIALAVVSGRLFGAVDAVGGIDWWFEKQQDGTAVIKSTMSTQTSAIDPNTVGPITVPSVLGGYPVTAIGPGAFSGCRNLTSVSIPAGVTRIDNSAFYDCSSLESVSLPDGVTALGNSAFHSCGKLRECELPASVRTIGSSAFGYCSSMSNVVFSGRIESVGSSAFYYCSSLSNVVFSGAVGSVGSSAFQYCTSLKDVRFGSTVGKTGDSAFFKCTSLADVRFAGDVGAIGETAFYGCTALTNVAFGAALTNIQNYAFSNCESLPGVSLPSNVASIAEGAFYNCRAFESFVFPTAVDAVSDAVLAGCSNLVEIVIPEGVFSIGNGAFLNCSKLQDVDLPKGILTIEKRAFEGTAFWKEQPDNSIVMSGNYVIGIKGKCPAKVVISNGVETISANMFRDCTNLVEIDLPQGLVSIGDYAFYNTGLSSVTFPSGLKNVGERAFAESMDLTWVSNVSGFRCGEGAFEHTGLPTVSVGFDANRGRLDADATNKSFTVGVPYGVMPVPTRSSSYNYQFAGWHTAAKGGALVAETNIVSDTLTMLYAHWQTDYPFTYYARFYLDSEATSSSYSQTLTNGVVQVLRKNDFYSKPGYLFAGWTAVRGGAVVYSDGDRIAESLASEAGESVPLYACWVDNTYDVMGSGRDFEKVSSFPVGWTGRLDWETLQSGDKRQTISFKVGSSRKADIVVRGLEGSSIPDVELWRKLPSAVSAWERVCSVYSTAAASCDFTKDAQYQLRLTSSTLTKGSLVYSIGIGMAVSAYFDPDGGSGGGTKPYIANLPYGVLPTVTKNECDFDGWYTKSGVLVKEGTMVSSSVTNLIARWAMRHTYYVAFNANGGQGMMEQVAHKYGETFFLPANAFIRDRYRFDGWALTADGSVKYADGAKVSDLVRQSGGKLELYAVWSRIREALDYPIATGSVTNDIGAVSVISNSLIFTGTLTAATNRHCLVFTAADSDICRLAVDPKAGLRRGAKLSYGSVLVTDLSRTSQELSFERGDRVCLVVECALQGEDSYEYEVSVGAVGRMVSYDLNGGVLVGGEKSYGANFNFTVGTPVGYLPTPTNLEEEVFFLGWYDAATNLCDATKLVPQDGLVLTAKWTDPPPYEYTIRFDGNGSTGMMPDLTCRSDVEFMLPNVAFDRAGWVFRGWSTEPNGVVAYTNCTVIVSPLVSRAEAKRGDCVSLYARWMTSAGIEEELVDGIVWHYKTLDSGVEICNTEDGVNFVAAISTSTSGNLQVPETLGGLPVVAIGSHAFDGCNLLTTSVVISEGVERIGDYAFRNCTGLNVVKYMGDRPVANPCIYMGTKTTLVSGVRKIHTDTWEETPATDGEGVGTLPRRWPLDDGGMSSNGSRQIAWWNSPADGTVPSRKVTFYYQNGTGGRETLSIDDLMVPDAPDSRSDRYGFLGWFTKPYGGVYVDDDNIGEFIASGVFAFYAQWELLDEDGNSQSWDDVTYDVAKSCTYDGYLLDGAAVVGTVQLKMAKGKYDRENECYNVSVTAKAFILGEGKNISFKGVAEDVGEEGGSADLVCTKKSDEREMSVDFEANSLEGDFDGYKIVAARNMFGEKTDWDKRTARAADNDCGGAHVVILRAEGDSPLSVGYVPLLIKISKKGKAKVSGVMPDGTKVSVSAQLQIACEPGDDVPYYELPVVVPLYSGKRGGFGFGLQFLRDEELGVVSNMTVFGVTEWTANPGNANEFTSTLTEVGVGAAGNLAGPSAFEMEGSFDVNAEITPDGTPVTPSGAKWVLPKADKVKFDRESESYEVTTDYGNPAGLKLTYTAKTGTFKGSFKVYAVTDAGRPKKYTANVTGAVLGGVGYGTATIKKVGAVPVVIEEEAQ